MSWRASWGAILCSCVVAGCGGGGDGGSSTTEKAWFATSTKRYSDDVLGTTVDYPVSWRQRGGLSSALVLSGPSKASCHLTESPGSPPTTSAAEREAVLRKRLEPEKHPGFRFDFRAEQGANVTGTGAHVTAPGGLEEHEALFTSAGLAVSVDCEAPGRAFAQIDHDAFAPIIASVRLRRDPAAEKLHAELGRIPKLTDPAVNIRKADTRVLGTIADSGDAEAVARTVMRATLRARPDAPVEISLQGPADELPTFARFDPATKRGAISVRSSKHPEPFTP